MTFDATSREDLYRPSRSDEYAAAGADAAQRSRVVRGRPCAGRANNWRARGRADDAFAGGVRSQAGALSRRASGRSRSIGGSLRGRARALPGARGRCGRCRGAGHGRRRNPGARGVDDRRERPAESRRDGDEAIERAQTMGYRKSTSDPRSAARPSLRAITRRHFFEQTSFGIGGLALASLMDTGVLASPSAQAIAASGARRALDFPAKAKRVIYLFMAGAPSQLDLFDPKPALTKHDGQEIPEELIKGERFAFIKGTPKLLASPFQFAKSRSVRRRDLRVVALSVEGRGRHHHRAVDAHDAVQPRPGPDLHEYRPSGDRTSELRVLAQLRSWQREREPAGLRRPAVRREQPGRREIMLGERLPAHGASGCRVSIQRGAGALRLESCGRRCRGPAAIDRGHQRSQSPAPRRRGSRDRDADRGVRARLSHADQRAGAHRRVERAAGDPRSLRHRARQSHRSPTIACSHAGSSSAAFGSSSSITAAGTRTAPASARTSSRSSRICAARPTVPFTRC